MKCHLAPDRLVLIPESDLERHDLEAWRQSHSHHLLEIAGNEGDALVLNDLGPRSEVSHEPINIHSHTPDPTWRLIGNFAPTPFYLDGAHYASVESFWQSLKFDDERQRTQIARADGADAKSRGEEKGYGPTIRYGGEEIPAGTWVHWQLMEKACRAKFTQNAEARAALLSTTTRPLEHRLRHDSRTIPGVIMAGIWMKLRHELAVSPP
jgi:hypothetical protein